MGDDARITSPGAIGSPARRSETAVEAILVLAAGEGKRMRSSTPKVLHRIAGRPLLWHALGAAAESHAARVIAVIGHGREEVGRYLSTHHPQVEQVVQAEQLGTGHAVACGLSTAAAVGGIVLVTYGDVPLLSGETLLRLAAEHHRAGSAATVLTAVVPDPTGYGRIIRDSADNLIKIVEHKDASSEQLAINEINSGVYAFDGAVLARAIGSLTANNEQGELYLTDIIALARAEGHQVGTMATTDIAEVEGVNDRVQLAELSREMNARLVKRAQLAGVTINDPASTWIHADVAIGPDTQLLPGCSLEAGSIIGSNCLIGPDTTLSACQVDDGATVVRSHCVDSSIGRGVQVGPYAYLRGGALLSDGAKVGTFVEIKKSTIGPGAKVPHLSYVGDATVGRGTNIGAGVVTANYDGVGKYPTTIGQNVFVGSNSTLVAPRTVNDGAYIAAGSTVTDDVGPGDLAVARSRQTDVGGWVLRRRAGTPSDTSARAARARTEGVASPHCVEGSSTGQSEPEGDRRA